MKQPTKNLTRKRRYGQTYEERYAGQKNAIIEIRAKYRLLATIEGLQTYTDLRNFFHAGEHLRWIFKGCFEWIYISDKAYLFYKDLTDRRIHDTVGRVPEHWKRKDPRFWKPFKGAGYFQPEVKTDITTPLATLLPQYEEAYSKQFWRTPRIRGSDNKGEREGSSLPEDQDEANTSTKDIHSEG